MSEEPESAMQYNMLPSEIAARFGMPAETVKPSRAAESMKPLQLTPEEAAVIDRHLAECTAKPKVVAKP